MSSALALTLPKNPLFANVHTYALKNASLRQRGVATSAGNVPPVDHRHRGHTDEGLAAQQPTALPLHVFLDPCVPTPWPVRPESLWSGSASCGVSTSLREGHGKCKRQCIAWPCLKGEEPQCTLQELSTIFCPSLELHCSSRTRADSRPAHCSCHVNFGLRPLAQTESAYEP